MSYPKPVIVVSKCLEFDACRYNGARLPDGFVRSLQMHVTFAPVCPEVEIGLGVPRDPVRLVEDDGAMKMIQPASGKDLTTKMNRFARSFSTSLSDVDGFILKKKSPSCGVSDAKRFGNPESSMSLCKGPGLFTQTILEQFGHLAVEDEARLLNFNIRQHFLTHLYTSARFRHIKSKSTARALVDFHAKNKYLLLTYNQTVMRRLGRIVANEQKKKIDEVCAEYERTLFGAFAKIPRYTSHVNTLQHGFGYVSDKLNPAEKRLFTSTLKQYQAKQVPLAAVTSLLKAWITRYEVEYLDRQTYFDPFPIELASVLDSGKGREV